MAETLQRIQDGLDGLLTLGIIEIIGLALLVALMAAWIMGGRDE